MTFKAWAESPSARADLRNALAHPLIAKAFETLRKRYLPRPLPEASMTEDQQRGLAALYQMHAGFYAALNALENLPDFELAEAPPSLDPWGRFLPEDPPPQQLTKEPKNARRRRNTAS